MVNCREAELICLTWKQLFVIVFSLEASKCLNSAVAQNQKKCSVFILYISFVLKVRIHQAKSLKVAKTTVKVILRALAYILKPKDYCKMDCLTL